jgi:hypothetical protein
MSYYENNSSLKKNKRSLEEEDRQLKKGKKTWEDAINHNKTIEEGIFKGEILIEGKKIQEDTLNHNKTIEEGTFENEILIHGKKSLIREKGTFENGLLVRGKKIQIFEGNHIIEIGFFHNENLKKGKRIINNKIIEDGFFIDEVLIEGKRIFPNQRMEEGIFENKVFKTGKATCQNSVFYIENFQFTKMISTTKDKIVIVSTIENNTVKTFINGIKKENFINNEIEYNNLLRENINFLTSYSILYNEKYK